MDIYSRIRDISIGQIMVFLQCMELKNYSSAAAALNYTPSMVSKTIRKLEDKLGIILFTRRGSVITPTSAAYHLQDIWTVAVQTVERGVEKAYIAQAGSADLLRIGLINDSEYAANLLLTRAKKYDSTFSSLFVEKVDMHALPDLLKSRRYDVIITAYHEHNQLDGSECVWRIIEFTKLAFFIPERHPLYTKEELSLEDFSPCTFVVMDPLTNTGFRDMFLTACHDGGFEPRIAHTVLNSASMRFSLEFSPHIVCGDSTICQWQSDHVRMYEVDVPNITGLIIAWRKDDETERILHFVDVICEPAS